MTREAKIGMLTGLGVIILIGVLLSKYLGDPSAIYPGKPPSRLSLATGQMADLPVGAPYRQQVMAPVSVPPMGMDSAQTPVPEGHTALAPSPSVGMPPSAYAIDSSSRSETDDGSSAGPAVRAPVSPQPAGPVPTLPPASGEPPLIMLADGVHPVVLPRDQTLADSASPASTGRSYTIAAGDNLYKIAKKFYNSAKPTDLERIVAANPSQLKDVNSTLVQGHKLLIPGVPAASGTTASRDTARPDPETIPLPGNVKNASSPDAGRKNESARKAAAASYQVHPGDTLQKIARKLAPSRTTEMMQKIASLNGLKDPDALQAGMKLKVPALGDGHAAAGGK